MGRYNRQARRKMRKSLGAGTKISNEALETAIDMQREAMQAERLVPTMKNLISEDLRKKYEKQVNQEILPRISEQYLLMTMYILHTWDKTRFGPKRMQDFFVEIFHPDKIFPHRLARTSQNGRIQKSQPVQFL